jgi:pimeloyl-ACP methyl ester carboxylesterase
MPYARLVSTAKRMIQTPDGRWLEVLASDGDGLPLLFHNGTPGGLTAFGPMTDAAAARGLRTVMYARPGYGESTPQPGRQVADCAADAAAVLDQLGADRFLTIGWSGGGPHALACAARLPGRCLAAASLAGVAPSRADGLDWLAEMGPENIEEFSAADGWGFDVADCSAVPVAVWQGDQDLMVPFDHGAWLAAHIPGARAHLRPGEGHLTLATRAYGQVLDDLLDMAGRPPASAGGG